MNNLSTSGPLSGYSDSRTESLAVDHLGYRETVERHPSAQSILLTNDRQGSQMFSCFLLIRFHHSLQFWILNFRGKAVAASCSVSCANLSNIQCLSKTVTVFSHSQFDSQFECSAGGGAGHRNDLRMLQSHYRCQFEAAISNGIRWWTLGNIVTVSLFVKCTSCNPLLALLSVYYTVYSLCDNLV